MEKEAVAVSWVGATGKRKGPVSFEMEDEDGNEESPEVKEGEGGEQKNAGGASSGIKERLACGRDEDALVYWESLLDQKSLHVLVVENDASVRLVITLLLRKCGYQVTVAANGLQAWKQLKDLSNHFDIILCEVDLPHLSGVSLLCKIMSHNIRKDIPVVMMSYRDSIGLVFQCLSAGAVDYLLKPVRKNELKKLWLHIWRRWHSSCSSESENGAQAQNLMKLKGVENFDDDNTGSNDKDDSASFVLIDEGGSDNASDTKSSGTKPVVEDNSSQQVSPLDQTAECPDLTSTLDMHSNSEVFGQEKVPIAIKKECQADEKQLDGRVSGSKQTLKDVGKQTSYNFTKEESSLHPSIKRIRKVDCDSLCHVRLSVLSRSLEYSLICSLQTDGHPESTKLEHAQEKDHRGLTRGSGLGPIHIGDGPITRAKAQKMREALHGLI